MVGAVLVHEGRIIGEGWHRKYGEAHAEVNCLRSVAAEDRHLIPQATLYCSLEPCFHYGKTPPCVDLILREKIARVVVSNTDPNPKVAGQSLAKLREAGVTVETCVLEAEGRWLNRAFFHWIEQKRPYVILKWAQSANGYIGKPGERTAISGAPALRLVHRWRGEADAILVGTNTALTDNPRLDTRLYPGRDPLRITVDRQGMIPPEHHLLDDHIETWIFGKSREGNFEKTAFFPLENAGSPVPFILERLYEAQRAILLVEGGAAVLYDFLQAGTWNEIRVLENTRPLQSGIPAPSIPADAVLREQLSLGADHALIFSRRQKPV